MKDGLSHIRSGTVGAMWPRPVPLIGDPTSTAERAADPAALAFPADVRARLYDLIFRRRGFAECGPSSIGAGAAIHCRFLKPGWQSVRFDPRTRESGTTGLRGRLAASDRRT